MGKARKTLTDVIRRQFEASGMSILALSKRSGTAYGSCHGLITTGRDVTITTADKVARTLDLELVPRKRKDK